MTATNISDPNVVGDPDTTNESVTELVFPVVGLVIGILAGWSGDGSPLVNFDGNPALGPVAARAFAILTPADIGKMVALQFERGDIGQVAVIGILHQSALRNEPGTRLLPAQSYLQVIDNGDELRLVANRKLTLQCGRASITLDVDGGVEIRGQDVLSRAAGQNRIKGSSISLN
ncbi:DUF6484 domain-containing protein [Massilia sp. CCM 8734]|uniref:DUF6484 domain-containing protein n=1 Tax=Massilia sp. CCM 8734 TaxID=2609283 RepID=UPI00141D93D1|nr:DUF6484 domain-containing protein [Massilia sp. CCM 8734]NIA00559.1 hypothetical protein [Massilia sp. CCM 8734]